jgi:endonuclease G
MKKLLTLIFTLFSIYSFSQKIDTIITNDVYTSYFSFEVKNPLLVVYKLHDGGGDCSRVGMSFTTDHISHTKIACASDYSHSGYDEGHMCNAEDFAYDCDLERQTFKYYNCVPQTPELNRGIWKSLETETRKLSSTDKLLVICGNIYNNKTIGSDVYIPVNCYKIVYSYIQKKIIYSVIFTNTSTPTQKDISIDTLNKMIADYNIDLNNYIK